MQTTRMQVHEHTQHNWLKKATLVTAQDVTSETLYVGQGYSNRTAKGTAVGDEPQTSYALFSGKHYNDGCCFDCALALALCCVRAELMVLSAIYWNITFNVSYTRNG